MLGVSHGALQFMTYEEMKNAYNKYRKLPIDSKLVSFIELFRVWDNRTSSDSINGRNSQNENFLIETIVTFVMRLY